MRTATAVAIGYAGLGLLALALVPVSAHGWLGLQPDPLTGLYAAILGMPWLLLAPKPASSLAGMATAAAAIAMNALVILAIGRAIARIRRRR